MQMLSITVVHVYHLLCWKELRHQQIKFVYREFERLATCIVNECQHSDPEKAMMIVERKSPCWNDMTCLQIAAASTNQVFLSTVTCQQSVDVTWKRGIMAGWYKVMSWAD